MFREPFAPLVEDTERKIYRYFTGEAWKISSSGKTIPIICPHDQTTIGTIQAVTEEEIHAVISHAQHVQTEWECTPIQERIDIIATAANILREYEEIFVDMLVLEIGKTKEESKKEVSRTADIIDCCTKEVMTIKEYSLTSDIFPGYKKGIIAHVQRVAHGVVLAIGPFNYPLNLVVSKVAPALLMGNSVVIKPPTQGSISGLLLTRVFSLAGVPDGVISCVTGSGREIGDYLITHPGISMIAFTGSTRVGQSIAKTVGMKPLLFECGGNNPVVVLPDADMNLTAKEVVKGGFSYAGQRCTGIKYVLGMKETLGNLLPLVLNEMKTQIQMGDPMKETTKLVGPVISLKAAEEIEQIIHDATTHGATIVTGGKRNGTYIEPTILTNVSADMKVIKEETFGPVICFIEVDSIEQAVSVINHSTYALQASIFSEELVGKELATKLQVGTVQINGSPQRGPDNFPFMGVKSSGLGVQGIRYSLEAMSRLKSIVMNSPF